MKRDSSNIDKLPTSPITKVYIASYPCHKVITTEHKDGTTWRWEDPCSRVNRMYWCCHGDHGWIDIPLQDAPRLVPEEVWDCLAGGTLEDK